MGNCVDRSKHPVYCHLADLVNHPRLETSSHVLVLRSLPTCRRRQCRLYQPRTKSNGSSTISRQRERCVRCTPLLIPSRLASSIKQRSAIGANSVFYSIYKALAVAVGAPVPTHKPEYARAEPPVSTLPNAA